MMGKVARLFKCFQGFDAGEVFRQYGEDKTVTVVSFDIFYTLILRDVAKPTDVFIVVERLCEGISDFARIRMEANAETLDGIYNTIQLKAECSDEIRDRYKACEIKCEIELSQPNLVMVELLKRFKDAGKRIILTSDMYLLQDVIKEILEHCGIERDLYERLYVSCEYHATKRSGELFKLVLKKEGLKANQLLHIGDAVRSDYVIPQRIGINAVHYNKDNIATFVLNRLDKFSCFDERKTINAFTLNHTQKENYYRTLGFRCVGPLLYGFSKWIRQQIKKSGYHGTVYFLAREGAVFMEAYEAVATCEDVKTEYLEISRRSVVGALLWKRKSIEEQIRIFDDYKFFRHIHLKTIANLLNADGFVKHDREWEKLKDRSYASVKELLRDKETISFLMKYKKDIDAESKRQYNLLLSYLSKKRFINNETEKDVFIVDIGWKGTMQELLKELLSTISGHEKIRITGLYLGVRGEADPADKNGYLFESGKGIPEPEVFAFGGLLESMLSERKGSIVGYEGDKSSVRSIRGNYEYTAEDEDKIKQIQEGAQDYINTMRLSILARVLRHGAADSSANILHFANHPTKHDVDMVLDMNFKDDSYETHNIDKGQRMLSYRQMMNSNWKVGALKRYFGGWMPACRVYKVLYGLRGIMQ